MTNAKKNELAKELLPLLVSKLTPSYSACYLLDRLEEIITGLEERGYFEEENYAVGSPKFKDYIYTFINQDSKD